MIRVTGILSCEKFSPMSLNKIFSILPKEKRTFLFMELFGLWGSLRGGGGGWVIYDS